MKNSALLVTLLGLAVLGGCASGGKPNQSDGVTPSQAAARINLQLGIAYLKQGNLALAKEKLDRALSQGPRDADVHSALALLEDRLGHVKEADNYFRTALRLAPNNPDISNNYAIYLCRNNRAPEGVERFLVVARNGLYASPEAAYTNAAVCQRGAGLLEAAVGNLQLALRARPNYAEAAYQLADLQFSRGKTAESRAVLDQFIGSFVNVTPEMLLLGVRAAQAQGDRLGAERYARRLRLDFPNSDQTRSLSPSPGAPSAPNNPG